METIDVQFLPLTILIIIFDIVRYSGAYWALWWSILYNKPLPKEAFWGGIGIDIIIIYILMISVSNLFYNILN